MMLYKIVMTLETDNPEGVSEMLHMAAERLGRVKSCHTEPLEEQARIGDSGAAAKARAQLEAALGKGCKCKQ